MAGVKRHRTPTTITVDPAVLAWVDQQVETGTFRNRSSAFEEGIKALMLDMEYEPSREELRMLRRLQS